jgi:bacteriocin biosynthesis cyclodehydratase domain-containing protein
MKNINQDLSALYGLRPGAELFRSSLDRVQVVFANHTATFSGKAVVDGVVALSSVLGEVKTRDAALTESAEISGLTPEFLQLVFDLLVSSACLFRIDSNSKLGMPRKGVAAFLASIGTDPNLNYDQRRGRVVLITPATRSASIQQLLQLNELEPYTVALEANGEYKDPVTRALSSSDATPVLCWGYSYRSPLAREVNKLCVSQGREALFGFCEGLVGRIGPWLIPQNGPCLECLLQRLLSNSGRAELEVDKAYQRAYELKVPELKPTHPGFEALVASAFALEAARIAWRLQPSCLGGVLEHSFVDHSVVRRTVLRAPRCPACRPERPRRLAWNAIYPQVPADPHGLQDQSSDQTASGRLS